MDSLNFGRWIKKLRNEQDLTQEMLSERVGCATPTLRAFEIGKRRPSREMAERIADVLQVPMDERAEFLRLALLPLEPSSNGDGEGDETLAPTQQGETTATSPMLPPLAGLFIGREAEQNALQQLLIEDRQRLITLVGAGGIGKTRLALEIAHRITNHLKDGAAFVALAPLQTAQHLTSALTTSLTINTQGAPSLDEALFSWLADKEMLLVFDNFEHLLVDTSSIAWIKLLMQRAPGVQLLITSRERLRISGERIFELGGLGHSSNSAHPVDESDAVLLFLARAEQVASDFVLDSTNRACPWRLN